MNGTPIFEQLAADYRRRARKHAILRALGLGPGLDRHARTNSWFDGDQS